MSRNRERLLGQNVPEKFDLEGAGSQYEQPRCPKCGSMDVSFEGLMKRVAGAGLFLGLPLTVKMKGWNCNSCEHQWGIEDEGKKPNLCSAFLTLRTTRVAAPPLGEMQFCQAAL